MALLESVNYSVRYLKPNYTVKIQMKVRRGILFAMAEKANVSFKIKEDGEPIRVNPDHFQFLQPHLDRILTAIEKKTKEKYPSFSFFSTETKEILLEKNTDRFYNVTVFLEGMTAYA